MLREPLLGRRPPPRAGTISVKTYPLSFMLSSIALALIIASAVTPLLYKLRTEVLTNQLNVQTGPFRQCWSYKDFSECHDIDRDCKVPISSVFPSDWQTTVFERCSQFNAARILMLFQILLVGLASFCQFLAICHAFEWCSVPFAMITNSFATIIGIIVMCLFIHLKQTEDTILINNSDFSVSFILLCISWPLSAISTFLFAIK